MKEKLKQLQSFITLTYPVESYPKEEKVIKLHLQKFIKSLRVKSNELKYIYVYEMHENKNIHIHMLVNEDYSKSFYRLKEKW